MSTLFQQEAEAQVEVALGNGKPVPKTEPCYRLDLATRYVPQPYMDREAAELKRYLQQKLGAARVKFDNEESHMQASVVIEMKCDKDEGITLLKAVIHCRDKSLCGRLEESVNTYRRKLEDRKEKPWAWQR